MARAAPSDPLEAQVEANLKRAERLRQAILKRAFEGRLVPQDPTNEPASVLLERIRVERDATKEIRATQSPVGARRRQARTQPDLFGILPPSEEKTLR